MLHYKGLFDKDKDLPEKPVVFSHTTDTVYSEYYSLWQKSQNDALNLFQWKNLIVSLVSYNDLLLHKAIQKQCVLLYNSQQSVHLICCLNLCTASLNYPRDQIAPVKVWFDLLWSGFDPD